MTDLETDGGGDVLGPVDFVVVEFPDGTPTAGGFEQLLDLADRHVIRILDLEFITLDADGVHTVEIADLGALPGVDLTVWEGASSGLLDDDDLAMIGAEMTAGSVAVVVVFENLWVLGVVDGWAATGGRLIFDGAVPAQDLLAALDSTEPT